MKADKWPFSETKPSRHGQPQSFATWFAAIGFLVSGPVVFLYGFILANPSPPPPGQANCGNEALGGWFLMVIVAPVAGVVISFVGLMTGIALDNFRRARSRLNQLTARTRID